MVEPPAPPSDHPPTLPDREWPTRKKIQVAGGAAGAFVLLVGLGYGVPALSKTMSSEGSAQHGAHGGASQAAALPSLPSPLGVPTGRLPGSPSDVGPGAAGARASVAARPPVRVAVAATAPVSGRGRPGGVVQAVNTDDADFDDDPDDGGSHGGHGGSHHGGHGGDGHGGHGGDGHGGHGGGHGGHGGSHGGHGGGGHGGHGGGHHGGHGH